MAVGSNPPTTAPDNSNPTLAAPVPSEPVQPLQPVIPPPQSRDGNAAQNHAMREDQLQAQLPCARGDLALNSGKYQILFYLDQRPPAGNVWSARVELQPISSERGVRPASILRAISIGDDTRSPVIALSPDDPIWHQWLNQQGICAVEVKVTIEPAAPQPPISSASRIAAPDAAPQPGPMVGAPNTLLPEAPSPAQPTTRPVGDTDSLRLSLNRDRWLEPVMPISLTRDGIRVLPRAYTRADVLDQPH
jgi:hypothetical protein